MNAIEITDLRRSFGHHQALDGLDLTVPAGSAFGFVGANGAGKTTTIRILLGLARADSGTATILGNPLGSPEIARRVGYLPDAPAFYTWMTARQYLDFSARAFGIASRTARRHIELLLEMVDLARVTTAIGGFSRGMKQRLGIAQALINAPDLLILDEPTSALDPMGRHDLLRLIERLRGTTTVFFSTHVLADVERVCDRVAVMNAGRVIAEGSPGELRDRARTAPKLRLTLAEPDADLTGALAREPWAGRTERIEAGHWLIDVDDLAAASHRIPVVIAQQNWGLMQLEALQPTLEDAFVRLVSEVKA